MQSRILLAILVFSALLLGVSAQPAEFPEEVTDVIDPTNRSLTVEEWEAMLGKLTPEMWDQLFDAAQSLPAGRRAGLIQWVVICYPGHGEKSRGGIATRHIICYLVKHLSDSEAPVRDRASYKLYLGVPDISLRDFAEEILRAIREHPETKYAPRLVGKLGCAAARDLLKIPEVVEEMTPQEPIPKGEGRNIAYEAGQIERRNLMKMLDVEAALARLGDWPLEWKFLDGFRNRTKEDTWMWIQYLGYIASPGCVVGLARGFLEEPYYPNTGAGPPTWEIYADALHEALPYDPAFWRMPGRNGYRRVTAWVKDYLRIEPRQEETTSR